MALLHIRRTLTNGCGDDIVVATVNEREGPSTSPTRGLEVVGVQGRVQEMVLRFSVSNSGLYLDLLYTFCFYNSSVFLSMFVIM